LKKPCTGKKGKISGGAAKQISVGRGRPHVTGGKCCKLINYDLDSNSEKGGKKANVQNHPSPQKGQRKGVKKRRKRIGRIDQFKKRVRTAFKRGLGSMAQLPEREGNFEAETSFREGKAKHEEKY